MKTKIFFCRLAASGIIAVMFLTLFAVNALAQEGNGSISYNGKGFAGVLGEGNVKINALGENILIVKGSPHINNHGVGLCNKTRTHILCKDIETLDVSGKNIRLAVKGNGSISAEGKIRIILGKEDLSEGNATLSYGKKGFLSMSGQGILHINSTGKARKNFFVVNGADDMNKHRTGRCIKIRSYTACWGVEKADIIGKNIRFAVKGKGVLNAEGDGKITVWN